MSVVHQAKVPELTASYCKLYSETYFKIVPYAHLSWPATALLSIVL